MEKYQHKYGAEQIQVLEGLEAVRKRPGMYIGSTSVRGLHHMVYEIVDNGVDEALAGYCTEINVIIEKGNIITVIDNGRGIPVEIHPKTHISTAETVYTVLHAGGKFGGDSGYKVSGGLHGVGASVVNALSSWTEVTIQRDGGIFEMKFEKGKTTEKLKKIGESKKTGTKVRFLADDTIFESLQYEYDVLEKRLREIAFLTKGLKITLEDQRGETPKKAEFCYEGGLISFVEYLNKNKEKIHPTPIYIEKQGEVPVEIAIQYTSSYTENIYTFVNNINTVEGGTHLEGFKRALTKVFNDYARSHNILKEKDNNLQGEDITDSDLYVFFEYINSTVNGLKIQLKHLDPTLKYNREKKSEIKLSLFFKEESEYYKNRLQKNSIDFTIFLEDDFSISINRGKIVQIIDNLISNSEYWLIKLKGNDPNCKPSITIKIESPWIYFYDNGYGISPAIENMLFEPFVTTKPKGEGRGLGLFIIQQLLDSSKCTIALEPFRNEHGRKYIFAINFSNIINEYK